VGIIHVAIDAVVHIGALVAQRLADHVLRHAFKAQEEGIAGEQRIGDVGRGS
jgi:hypothetical protein